MRNLTRAEYNELVEMSYSEWRDWFNQHPDIEPTDYYDPRHSQPEPLEIEPIFMPENPITEFMGLAHLINLDVPLGEYNEQRLGSWNEPATVTNEPTIPITSETISSAINTLYNSTENEGLRTFLRNSHRELQPERRELTYEEYQYLNSVNVDIYHQWMRDHIREINIGSFMRWNNGEYPIPVTPQQRELTREEYEVLNDDNTSITQFREWFRQHPEVDQHSFNTWGRRIPEEVTMPRGVYTRTPRRDTREESNQAVLQAQEVERTRLTSANIYTAKCMDARNGMEALQEIQEVLSEYARLLKRNIKFFNKHSQTWRPENSQIGEYKDSLVVVFWSTPCGSQNTIRTSVVYGIPLNTSQGQGDTNEPNEDSRLVGQFFTDDEGTEVFQVVNNTIYVLFDLPQTKGEHTKQIMERIMQEYMTSFNPEEVEMRKRKSEELALTRVSEVMSEILVALPNNQLTEEQGRVEHFQIRVNSYQAQMMESIKMMVQAQQRVKELKSTETSLSTKTERELKSIRKIKGVERVTTNRTVLRVVTQPIFITTDVNTYDIGTFEMQFSPNGEFKIVNVTRKVHKYEGSDALDHPHINRGVPCWGNLKNIATNVISGEIAMSVAMIMEYLTQFTPGDAWGNVDLWPVVETDTKIPETAIVTHPDLVVDEEHPEEDEDDDYDADREDEENVEDDN